MSESPLPIAELELIQKTHFATDCYYISVIAFILYDISESRSSVCFMVLQFTVLTVICLDVEIKYFWVRACCLSRSLSVGLLFLTRAAAVETEK